ncbi:MAG: Ribosome maturation factor RimM [Holosporales bacterium]
MSAHDLILVAEIVGSHGVKGQFKIRSFTSDPHSIRSYFPLKLEDGTIPLYSLKIARHLKDSLFLATSSHATNKDQADALNGTKFYINKADLPAISADEYYFIDLVECKVFEENILIGCVTAVHDFGAGTFLDICLEDSKKTATLPFSNDAILSVNIETKKIIANKGYVLA